MSLWGFCPGWWHRNLFTPFQNCPQQVLARTLTPIGQDSPCRPWHCSWSCPGHCCSILGSRACQEPHSQPQREPSSGRASPSSQCQRHLLQSKEQNNGRAPAIESSSSERLLAVCQFTAIKWNNEQHLKQCPASSISPKRHTDRAKMQHLFQAGTPPGQAGKQTQTRDSLAQLRYFWWLKIRQALTL